MRNRTVLLIFAIISIMFYLQFMSNISNSSSSHSSHNSSYKMKFYTFPECSRMLKILNEKRISLNESVNNTAFNGSVNSNTFNMYIGFLNTSYRTDDITLATYCLSASYCARDLMLMERMEKICPKILVLELDTSPRLLNHLLANSKVHYLLSNCRPQYFRPNQDICLPVTPRKQLQCERNTGFARQYVASFVGTIYTNSYARHRYTLKWLNETSDIFIKFNCTQPTNVLKMKSYGSKYLRTACDRYESSLLPSDFCKSLNSTFILCPGGRQPASYRFLEALMVNSIPVLYYESFDGKVPMPFHRAIDWKQCTKVYTEIIDVERLIQSNETVIASLLKGCSNVYQSHLSSFEMMAMTTNQELQVLANIMKSQRLFNLLTT